MTHLHTSTVKDLVAMTRRRGLQVIFDRQDILARGGAAAMADRKMYIRSLGRQAMPHVFHTNDFIKKNDCISQSQYGIEIHQATSRLLHFDVYNASTGGAQRWLRGIRPPSPQSMHVSHHPATSALRATTNWAPVPLALLLQPLETGWIGIQPTTVVMTRCLGGPGHGTLRRTRTSKQTGKALRSQGHPHARVM